MTTKWVVTTASEKIALDEATRGGEATFMVTNQSPKSARAMFDIKTGDGVEESWFSVEDPQRPIRPAASVPYLVRIQVPQTVAPGQYEFEARVYPPDSAPEENFVLSRRVLLEVPKKPEPPKKKFPWWIIVAAALLVLVLVIVAIIVWPSGGTPEAQPSASPSPTPATSAAPIEYALVPNMIRMTVEDSRKALADAGLQTGVVRYRKDGGVANVVLQSLPPNAQVAKGAKVDLELGMPFSVPTITAPGNNTNVAAGRWPTVVWSQPEPWVSRWYVIITAEQCTRSGNGASTTCTSPYVGAPYVVMSKELSVPMPKLNLAAPANGTTWHTGWVQVWVNALDDYGNPTANTNVRFYLVH